MKSANAQVVALLASNTFRMADLYTITLKSGTILRYTSADVPLFHGGLRFDPVPIERTKVKVQVGIEVDTLDVTVMPTEAMTLDGLPFNVAVRLGVLDGAAVLLEKAFIADWDSPVAGTLHQFEGTVAGVPFDGVECQLKVKSYLNDLNVEMPRNAWSPGCNNTLYDNACGVIRAAYAVSGVVQAGSTREVIKHILGAASGYYDYGVIEFQAGANAGSSRTVRMHTATDIRLAAPLGATPAAGDTFKIFPGCNRTRETCQNKFNNLIHFRGYPWIPQPETAY